MMLFLSCCEDSEFRKFVKSFSKKTNIKTKFIVPQDVINKEKFTLKCLNNEFSFLYKNLPFEDIKLCYINSAFSFAKNDFPFLDDLDAEYALQEWNAFLLCLFNANPNIKFINPHLKKYSLENEIEDILVLQKYDLKTVQMFLTNNSSDFLSINELTDKQLWIKSPLKGYTKFKKFEDKDLLFLDKLYISPYIFQKGQNGNSIRILIIDNEYCAFDFADDKQIKVPVEIINRLTKINKELSLSIATYDAIKSDDEYVFYSINQQPSFNDLYLIFGKDFTTKFSDYLIKEYTK